MQQTFINNGFPNYIVDNEIKQFMYDPNNIIKKTF